MAENKKSFLLYTDLLATVKKLPPEMAGKLFVTILEYVNDLDPDVSDDYVLDLVFSPIRQQLKRDLEKYEKIRERNRLNGSKHKGSKKPDEASGSKEGSEKNPVGSKRDPKQTDSDNGIGNVNGNDKSSSDKSEVINFDNLLAFINEQTGRSFQLINEKVRKKYRSLLKQGYKQIQIRAAITNACKVQAHKDNDYQYLTPEFFSRTDTIDKYGSLPGKAQSGTGTLFTPKTDQYTR